MILYLLFYNYTLRLDENGLTRYHNLLFFHREYNTPLDKLEKFEITTHYSRHNIKYCVTVNQDVNLLYDTKHEKIKFLVKTLNDILNNLVRSEQSAAQS
jgi:hypothetical protein